MKKNTLLLGIFAGFLLGVLITSFVAQIRSHSIPLLVAERTDLPEWQRGECTSAFLRFPIQKESWLAGEPIPYDEAFKEQQRRFRLHRQLILSHFVINQALREDGIGKLQMVLDAEAADIEPSDWIRQRLIVDLADDSEILKIGMCGGDRYETRTLVNAMTKAYLMKVVDEERKEMIQRLTKLREVYKEKTIELELVRKREDLPDDFKTRQIRQLDLLLDEIATKLQRLELHSRQDSPIQLIEQAQLRR